MAELPVPADAEQSFAEISYAPATARHLVPIEVDPQPIQSVRLVVSAVVLAPFVLGMIAILVWMFAGGGAFEWINGLL